MQKLLKYFRLFQFLISEKKINVFSYFFETVKLIILFSFLYKIHFGCFFKRNSPITLFVFLRFYISQMYFTAHLFLLVMPKIPIVNVQNFPRIFTRDKKTFLLSFNSSLWVGVNCSKCDCSTVICLTLLAGNQLLDTKFINCSNPVNPG
jgi:hypothetical protein